MTLSVGIIGDNPQQPVISAETYIPDQLIAGNLKLVTETVTLSGSSPLPRGTVVGRSQDGSTSSSTGKAFASGTILVTGSPLPSDGDTVTVNGTVVTFNLQVGVTQLPIPNQVLFQSSFTAAQVAQAFLAVLNSSTDANISQMTYSLSSATITATAKVIGTGGNSLTLATSHSASFTLSGATLSGGTANTGTSTIGSISTGTGTLIGNYVITLTSATQGFVVAPNGETVGQTTMGTAFVDSQINFTITTGGSPAAGDAFVITVADNTPSNVWKLCTATATDGSNIPLGILADFSDPSSGNVFAGVYSMGEFNGNAIVFDSSLTPQAIKNAFRGKGIFIKPVVSAADPT